MNQLLSWSIPSHLVLFTVYLSVCIYSEQNSVCTSASGMHKYRYIRPCYFLVIHYIDAYMRQAISVSVCLTSQACISLSYVLNFVTISFSSYLQDVALATHVFWCRNKGLYVVSSVGLSLSLLMFNNISALDLLVTQAKPRIASTKRYFFQSTPTSALLFFPSSLI